MQADAWRFLNQGRPMIYSKAEEFKKSRFLNPKMRNHKEMHN